jgi:hypothetical protein
MLETALPAPLWRRQAIHELALPGRAGPGSGAGWQLVTIEDDHLFEMVGKCLCGRQSAYTRADYNSPLTDRKPSKGISVVHYTHLSFFIVASSQPT